MRTITIGDLHGMNDWKRIDPEKYDVIVFLGDYVDSFFVDDDEMLNNLDEIIAFRKTNPNKVKLLLGNHEISYLYQNYRAAGYRKFIADEIIARLEQNKEMFQVAFQYKNYLWTHAGIHYGFYSHYIQPRQIETDPNLAFTLERLYHETFKPLFEIGTERGGRRNATGGPFWLDANRLVSNPLRGYHQIVGHTPVDSIQQYFPFESDSTTSVTLCDTIEYGNRKFHKMDF